VSESHADTVVVVVAVRHAVRYMECLCCKHIINTTEAAVSCQRIETKNKAKTVERGRGVASEYYDVTP
jgi:hypothetical protein